MASKTDDGHYKNLIHNQTGINKFFNAFSEILLYFWPAKKALTINTFQLKKQS